MVKKTTVLAKEHHIPKLVHSHIFCTSDVEHRKVMSMKWDCKGSFALFEVALYGVLGALPSVDDGQCCLCIRVPACAPLYHPAGQLFGSEGQTLLS